MTDGQADKLIRQQETIIEKLSKGKEKDRWDKISVLSSILSSFVIAGIGVYFTNAFKSQEIRVSEVEVIEKLVTHLSGTNENSKKGALLAMATLNKDMAIKLGALYASTGTIEAMELLLRNADGEGKLLLLDALVDAYSSRAQNSLDNYSDEQVIRDINKIFKLTPKESLKNKREGYFLADCYINRGHAYKNLQKYDLALSDYQDSLKIIPNYSNGYWALGGLFFDRKDSGKSLNEALKYYDLAELHGARELIYLHRGELRYEIGNIDLAIMDFDKYVLSNSFDYRGHYYRGLAYDKKNDLAAAAIELKKAMALASDPQKREEINLVLEKVERQIKSEKRNSLKAGVPRRQADINERLTRIPSPPR
jgi:hypothetical protein